MSSFLSALAYRKDQNSLEHLKMSSAHGEGVFHYVPMPKVSNAALLCSLSSMYCVDISKGESAFSLGDFVE